MSSPKAFGERPKAFVELPKSVWGAPKSVLLSSPKVFGEHPKAFVELAKSIWGAPKSICGDPQKGMGEHPHELDAVLEVVCAPRGVRSRHASRRSRRRAPRRTRAVVARPPTDGAREIKRRQARSEGLTSRFPSLRPPSPQPNTPTRSPRANTTLFLENAHPNTLPTAATP